jgi:hypothetical protein
MVTAITQVHEFPPSRLFDHAKESFQEKLRQCKACQLSNAPVVDDSGVDIRNNLLSHLRRRWTNEFGLRLQHALNASRHLIAFDEFTASDLIDSDLCFMPKPLVFGNEVIYSLTNEFVCPAPSLDGDLRQFGYLMREQFDIHALSLVLQIPVV